MDQLHNTYSNNFNFSQHELKKYMVTPLYRNDYRILTVHMYNPWVTEETIKYFLGRYVTVLPGVRKIKDGLGLWTGKRQFRVKLKMDMTTEDGYCHPPAVFSIGADRGFLVYAGQPQACRKCGSTGHNADNCEQVRCRSCGKNGHITRDCKEPRRCHLCGSDTHMARDCTRPRSYSEAAKAGTEVDYSIPVFNWVGKSGAEGRDKTRILSEDG
uniref:CCHC-type domain-containing protein n=1 Tax=Maylandia zebra TaxID=106582 RepID=A0A3P9DU06_9CICH